MAILECRNLCVGYDKHIVLSDIDFGLEKGCLGVLIGANGSGKSTLLRTMAGLQSAIMGEVIIDGQIVERLSKPELSALRAIVSSHQEGGGAMSVEDTVALGYKKSATLFGSISKAGREMVVKAITDVGLDGYENRAIATLSDGERQKVMIARALVQDTPLIFLDEPTAFLDVAARSEILRLLRRLADDGRCIVISTHDVAPAIANADYIIVADKKEHKVIAGPRREMIASKALDCAFANSGLRFDNSTLDFR